MRKISDLIARRPLFFLCLSLIPLFAIYACVIHRHPVFPFNEKQTVTLTGIVSEKVLDSDGLISAFYVKGKYNFKCYPSDLKIPSEALPLGAKVNVKGTVSPFRPPGNPGEFDAEKFYENRGYLFYMNVKSITLEFFSRFPLKEFFFRIKCHFTNIVKSYCPIEYGTINTLLFGDKSNLDKERRDLYRTAGLSHFLVISGLHVSIAGGGIYMFLRRIGMRRSHAAVLGISFIILYGLVIGFSVSVFRAICMYLIRLLADITKRTYDILTALGISAVLTLVVNPLWIRDSAFLYSYTAVLFTGLYLTYIKKRREEELFDSLYSLKGIKASRGKIKLYIAVPVVIYLSLLPISLYFQSYSNLLSVPLNVLLGLLTTPILVFGFLGFIFGCLHLSFPAGLSDYFCAILLVIIDKISSWVSKMDFSKIIYQPSRATIFLYYLLLFCVLFILPYYLSEKACLLLISIGIVLLGNSINPFPSITVLDVDQGDCIVIKNGKHSAIISDCGSTGRTGIGENIIIPYLYSQGITEITHIFISHADRDHINGIETLLTSEEIKIKNVIFPKISSDMWNEGLNEIKKTAMTNKVNIASVSWGYYLKTNSVSFLCLSPRTDALSGDSNQDSLVLWCNIYDFDALLTGDATEETERNLVLPKVSFEMLKVSHHGSRYSSSEDFLSKLKPNIAIVSAGKNNSYGHPHEETLERLKQINASVFRTDCDGAITVHIYPNYYTINSFTR